MSTKKRKTKKRERQSLLTGLLAGILGFLCCGPHVLGVYPLVPAYCAGCALYMRNSILIYLGVLAGIGCFMPAGTAVKYVFIILIISMAVRMYRWANGRCSSGVAALLAGLVTTAMNCSGILFDSMERQEIIRGVSEGVFVTGFTLLFHYISGVGLEALRTLLQKNKNRDPIFREQEAYGEAQGRIQAFAEAVDGLSAAFSLATQRPGFTGTESVAALEREVTGKLCASCEGCGVCWQEKRQTISAKIQRMLLAVVAHSPREEILKSHYMEECPRYPGMVEEALWAFSRMELNEAWYKRLQENRMMVARQLDAMADALQDWNKGVRNVDGESKLLMARIRYEVREKGLVPENIHILEDEQGRRIIKATVRSKWGGGIPAKNYRYALERAVGMSLRLQQDARSIFTQEAVAVNAYEDTCYEVLTGSASKKKEGSSISGDNSCLFELEDGRYVLCLSDGMGSGPGAGRESDMVVDLMEKFMTAGFSSETAIQMMNSAMVLKGEDDSYSTLDFASIDLYTGELEMTKIGGAASFIRHGEEVFCIPGGTLPAGAVSDAGVPPVHRKLTSGDFLVMVTDGVLEYLHVKNPEEKISEMIRMIQTDNAEVLAKKLLEHVMLFTGGHAFDDMTVIAAGIWEK